METDGRTVEFHVKLVASGTSTMMLALSFGPVVDVGFLCEDFEDLVSLDVSLRLSK